MGSFLVLPGRKSLLSKLTHWLAPESQIALKLSLGSTAALHATGCCSTTASEKRPLQLEHPVGMPVEISVGEILGVRVGVPVGAELGLEFLKFSHSDDRISCFTVSDESAFSFSSLCEFLLKNELPGVVAGCNGVHCVAGGFKLGGWCEG